MQILAIIVIMMVVGFINALKDISAINRFKKDWWNKGRSWKMKWKINDRESYPLINEKRPIYYLGLYKPKYIEKFPYSSTILVSFTDGWHLLQLIQFSILQLTLAVLISENFIETLLNFIVIKTVFSIVFELTYKKITK